MSAPAPTRAGRRRVRTPTILQMEAAECGAAALAIVLAHYGRWVPLETLREQCGVSRSGSRASNVVRAARAYGLTAAGKRLEPAGLSRLRLPLIVFWRFNHFVVVEGYDRRRVYLNDPATGPRRVSWEEFDDSFTGVAIELEPAAGFTRAGAPPSVAAGLARRLRGSTGPLVLCLVAGVGLLVPGLLVPAAVRIFVNEVLGGADRSWLWPLVAGASLAAIAQLAFTWLQQITLLRLSTRLAVSMSARFFEHVLRLPLPFFEQRYVGDVATRVQANDEVARLLSSQLAATALALVTSAFYLVLMVVYDWELAVASAAFAALDLLALQALARRHRDLGRRLAQDSGTLTATAAAGVQAIETLKATSEDGSFFARWSGAHANVIATTQSLGASSGSLGALPTLLGGLGAAVILLVGGLQVMSGAISLGTLAAVQVLAAGFAAPVGQLVGFGDQLQQVAGMLASLDDVLDQPAEEPGGQAPLAEAQRARIAAGRLSGRLELRDVSFGYNPLDPPLLCGISLTVEPGARVAVVGATGSGKSTVAGLAAGVIHPRSGDVLLDGIPRERVPRDVLAATVAFVPQETRLLQATVRDNLTLWDATIGDGVLAAATADAAIREDILRRPDGFDRPILEGGRDWSGGQRQRLELACALAREPALLILDEATSALDTLLERQVDEALRARGCACLIVAHRLSTIRDADEIVVLDAGRIAERGTHDELLARGGVYAALADA